MTRLVSSFLAIALVAVVACSAAPDRSNAAVLVGIGEHDASVFTDPLFINMGMRRARIVIAWNVMQKPHLRRYLDSWLDAASAAGVEPLVSFSQAERSKCPRRPCQLPTVGQFTRAFRAFQRRWAFVKVISPWNEANHRSQPTWRNPKRAAQYYNVVRKYCRGCTVVAADVIDETNMESWLRVFKRYARRPRVWGLHNYRDTNPRRGQRYGGTRRLLRTVRGQVWLTETGGIVTFRLPTGRTLFKTSTRRQNMAIGRMFRLARANRRRIKRLYVYHWKQPLSTNRFDAGLVDRRGRARPAYHTVRRHLRSRTFNP
jgi:hypothetical protein